MKNINSFFNSKKLHKKDLFYTITPEGRDNFTITKFLNNELEQQYKVNKKRKKWECSCISFEYRKYCKHKDWITKILRLGKELPKEVKFNG